MTGDLPLRSEEALAERIRMDKRRAETPMSRRRALLFTGMAIGGIAGLGRVSGSTSEIDQPPNIVLIMLDDAGLGDFGCYGGTAIDTPNIDAMAENGMQFSQAYAGSTVCAPSRSTLFDGCHAGNTSVRGNSGGVPLPGDTDTLSCALSESGYTVGGFGKWGLGDVNTSGEPTNHGFDEFFGYYDQVHAHSYYPEFLVHNGRGVQTSGYSQYAIFDRTLRFIEDCEERFFCYAPWTPPHSAFEIPDDDPAWQQYKNKDWPESARRRAAMVAMVDRQVGKLREKLRDLGIAENTLVLFTSDHGPNSGEFPDERTINANLDLRGHKRKMYEGGIRVPFVAEWPETIDAGSSSDTPIHFSDIYPTLAELAGSECAVSDDIGGRSFGALLQRPDSAPDSIRDFMYWERWAVTSWDPIRYDSDDVSQAVRVGEWKILRQTQSDSWELYDIAADRTESNDLADEKPETVNELAQIAERERSTRKPRIEEDGTEYWTP